MGYSSATTHQPGFVTERRVALRLRLRDAGGFGISNRTERPADATAGVALQNAPVPL